MEQVERLPHASPAERLPTSGELDATSEVRAFLRRAAEHMAPEAARLAGELAQSLLTSSPLSKLKRGPGRPKGQTPAMAERDDYLRNVALVHFGDLKSDHEKGSAIWKAASDAGRQRGKSLPGTPAADLWRLIERGNAIPCAKQIAKIISKAM